MRVSQRANPTVCADLEDVEPKSHLIVVAGKDTFKLQSMANSEAGESSQSSSTTRHSSDHRAVTPPHARPSDRTLPTHAGTLRPAPEPEPASVPALVPAATIAEAPVPPALVPAAMIAEAPVPSATFRKYDLNGDGVLDKNETINMMRSLGYKTDEAYLKNLMEAFASFDDDDSGLIEPSEFEALYAHLVCPHPPPGVRVVRSACVNLTKGHRARAVRVSCREVGGKVSLRRIDRRLRSSRRIHCL